jgi:hypothetical protein
MAPRVHEYPELAVDISGIPGQPVEGRRQQEYQAVCSFYEMLLSLMLREIVLLMVPDESTNVTCAHRLEPQASDARRYTHCA